LSGSNDRAVFEFQNASAGVYDVVAVGTRVRLLDSRGDVLAAGVNTVTMTARRPDRTYYVEISSATGSAVLAYRLGIVASGAASASVTSRRHR
jgi:hypothetical protein